MWFRVTMLPEEEEYANVEAQMPMLPISDGQASV
jgi:hypothetical protein